MAVCAECLLGGRSHKADHRAINGNTPVVASFWSVEVLCVSPGHRRLKSELGLPGDQGSACRTPLSAPPFVFALPQMYSCLLSASPLDRKPLEGRDPTVLVTVLSSRPGTWQDSIDVCSVNEGICQRKSFE